MHLTMNVIYTLIFNIISKLPVYIDGKPVDRRRKKSFLGIEVMLKAWTSSCILTLKQV